MYKGSCLKYLQSNTNYYILFGCLRARSIIQGTVFYARFAMRRRKVLYFLGVLITLLIVAIPIARWSIFNTLERKLRDKISSLASDGWVITYDSLYSDYHQGLLAVNGLVWRRTGSGADPSSDLVKAGEVRIKGLALIPLLLKSTIAVDQVIINDVRLSANAKPDWFSTSGTTPEDDLRLTIARFRVNALNVCHQSDSVLVEAAAIDNLTIHTQIDRPVSIDATRIQLVHVDMAVEEGLYRLTARMLEYDMQDHSLKMDTVRIKPQLDRQEFAKYVGIERDRIEGVIPFVQITGLIFNREESFSIRAEAIRLQGFLKFFRDKRLPHAGTYKPLPYLQMRVLPVKLHIDTITIEKSYVEYEEYAESATGPGKILFDDLTGTLANVSNIDSGKLNISASARLMGTGLLRMSGELNPTDKPSILRGRLSSFELTHLNKMLEPMAAMRIESGRLHTLHFDLRFNETNAHGSVLLNYNNLRMISLKSSGDGKNSGSGQDDIQTFILNTFVIKRNMTDNLPPDKRTGTIYYERDKSRSIFNFWWKSVFAGIKSTLKIKSPKN